jgi:hypothetical protein
VHGRMSMTGLVNTGAICERIATAMAMLADLR